MARQNFDAWIPHEGGRGGQWHPTYVGPSDNFSSGFNDALWDYNGGVPNISGTGAEAQLNIAANEILVSKPFSFVAGGVIGAHWVTSDMYGSGLILFQTSDTGFIGNKSIHLGVESNGQITLDLWDDTLPEPAIGIAGPLANPRLGGPHYAGIHASDFQHVRLVREGDWIYAYISLDGETWTAARFVGVDLATGGSSFTILGTEAGSIARVPIWDWVDDVVMTFGGAWGDGATVLKSVNPSL